MRSIQHPSKFRSLKLGIALFAVIALSLAAASPAAAATARYGPIASMSPDSGTCGNYWANDTFQRVFTVNNTTAASDGSYSVREDFVHGRFVTLAGKSPGACNSGTDNGGMVGVGVTGRMGGTFSIVVKGGTYHAIVCTQANCGTTADFIASAFGATATYDIPSFFFRYVTRCNGVWVNASADRGGNRGDITGLLHRCEGDDEHGGDQGDNGDNGDNGNNDNGD